MAKVSESIPAALQRDVDAALGWFNRDQDVEFEVTGILDAEASLAENGPRSLRLVLCGGDRCEQRSFRVSNGGANFEVSLLEDAAPETTARPAELDPPPGAMRGWLDRALSRHAFVVILFYRGFW